MADLKHKQKQAYPEDVRSRTFATVLEIAVENPTLGPDQIAALLQRDPQYIRSLMRSDAFIELRATRILERYGDKINGIRQRILNTTDKLLDAIQARIADPNSRCSENILLAATELMMKYVIPQVEDANRQPHEPAQQVNILLSAEDLTHARQRQSLHSLTTQPPKTQHFIEAQAEPAKPDIPVAEPVSTPSLEEVINSARGSASNPGEH